MFVLASRAEILSGVLYSFPRGARENIWRGVCSFFLRGAREKLFRGVISSFPRGAREKILNGVLSSFPRGAREKILRGVLSSFPRRLVLESHDFLPQFDALLDDRLVARDRVDVTIRRLELRHCGGETNTKY